MKINNISDLFELNHVMYSTFFNDLGRDFIVPNDLKSAHIKSLIIIKFAGEKMTMKDVSKGLNMVKGAFTPVANRLIKFEFIQKEKSENDKRVSYLILTEKGNEFVSEVIDILEKRVTKKLSVLSSEEQAAYLSAVRLVLSTTRKIASTSDDK